MKNCFIGYYGVAIITIFTACNQAHDDQQCRDFYLRKSPLAGQRNYSLFQKLRQLPDVYCNEQYGAAIEYNVVKNFQIVGEVEIRVVNDRNLYREEGAYSGPTRGRYLKLDEAYERQAAIENGVYQDEFESIVYSYNFKTYKFDFIRQFKIAPVPNHQLPGSLDSLFIIKNLTVSEMDSILSSWGIHRPDKVEKFGNE